MEFDVRRCLLACEFRTRSLLNNNCVNIRSHVASYYLVLRVHLLVVQLLCSYNILFITRLRRPKCDAIRISLCFKTNKNLFFRKKLKSGKINPKLVPIGCNENSYSTHQFNISVKLQYYNILQETYISNQHFIIIENTNIKTSLNIVKFYLLTEQY